MPDAYTHLRTARHAAALAGIDLPVPAAFLAGANGPDPLFVYRFWDAHPAVDLPALGQRMHREQAGAFLRALVRRAQSPAQRSYAAGFVLHNTLDSLAHPYVALLTQQGGVYDIPQGHSYYEAALDTALWRMDFGHGLPSSKQSAPVLVTAELAQVAALLRGAIAEVYGEQVPILALLDCFSHFSLARWFFRSPLGGKKLIARVIDLALHRKSFSHSHMLPGRLRRNLPAEWTDPYTGIVHEGGMQHILTQAEELGAMRLDALDRYWAGRLTEENLVDVLGNASYDTGLPC